VPRKTRPGYINVSSFKPTHESFILTTLPETVCAEYKIDRHPDSVSTDVVPELPLVSLSGARTNRYHFLAKALNTKFALTPLHTNEEYALFNKALRTGGPFSAANGPPDFMKMAQWWSTKVDGKTIFYKFKEHLQSHYKTWNALRVEMTTLQLTEKDRHEFMDIVQSDVHTSLVLDESYSPVVQGRKAAASSIKIAVRNRQNPKAAPNQRNPPNATASSSKVTLDSGPSAPQAALPPPFIPPPHQPPPQFIPVIPGVGQGTTVQPRSRKSCAVCKSLNLGVSIASQCPGRGGRSRCLHFGEPGAIGATKRS
jgi:hypothetical protein